MLLRRCRSIVMSLPRSKRILCQSHSFESIAGCRLLHPLRSLPQTVKLSPRCRVLLYFSHLWCLLQRAQRGTCIGFPHFHSRKNIPPMRPQARPFEPFPPLIPLLRIQPARSPIPPSPHNRSAPLSLSRVR